MTPRSLVFRLPDTHELMLEVHLLNAGDRPRLQAYILPDAGADTFSIPRVEPLSNLEDTYRVVVQCSQDVHQLHAATLRIINEGEHCDVPLAIIPAAGVIRFTD